MSERSPGPGTRRLIKPMQWLLYAAASLVFLAGVQLFLLTERTDVYFAWTIASPFTAAVLGAAYWAAVPVEVVAARQASWAGARAAIPGIWFFTVLTLIATLLHFDRFHFSSPDIVPRTSAWLWFGIYTVVPAAMVLVVFLELRAPGGDPERVKALPMWLRIALLGLGGGMIAVGAVLFATPDVFIPVWPWPLTPLTARAVGAWLLGVGLSAVFALRENDFVRVRPVGAGFTFFAPLELIALARYPGEIDWGNAGAWVYLGFLIALLPIGLYAWLGFRGGTESQPSSL